MIDRCVYINICRYVQWLTEWWIKRDNFTSFSDLGSEVVDDDTKPNIRHISGGVLRGGDWSVYDEFSFEHIECERFVWQSEADIQCSGAGR